MQSHGLVIIHFYFSVDSGHPQHLFYTEIDDSHKSHEGGGNNHEGEFIYQVGDGLSLQNFV